MKLWHIIVMVTLLIIIIYVVRSLSKKRDLQQKENELTLQKKEDRKIAFVK